MLFGNSSPDDEPYFEVVAREIGSGELRTGLWARCMTDAKFDENRAKASYVKQRVKELKSETAAKEKLLTLTRAKTAAIEANQRLKELDQRQAKLAPAIVRRISIILAGTLLGLFVGGIISWFTSRASPVFAGTAFGFVGAWVALTCMPSQQKVDEELTLIRVERETAEAYCKQANIVIRKLS